MKFFRNMSITKKMIMICMNVCLIPLVIGFVVIYNIYVTRLNEHTMEFAQAFNAQITANLNHMIQDYKGISVSVLVDNELFFHSEKDRRSVTEIVRDNENMQRVLFRIVTLQPKVRTVAILMKNGDFIQTGSDGLKIKQTVFEKKPWVKELEQSPKNFYMIPAHRTDYWNSRNDELTITFVRKIMSSGVRYRGAVLIDVDPASIIVLNEEYENAKQKYDMEIRIEDSDRNILYDSRMMGEPAQWREGYLSAEKFGPEYIVFEQQSEDMGLTVYTAIPRDSLLMEKNAVLLMTVLTVFLCGVSIVFMIIPLTRFMTSRLIRVSYGMSQMKNGKYIMFPEDKGSDELGILVNSYNHMVNEMQQLINKIYVAELVKKESEIVALQSQINPHMLFNTLETIRMKSLYNGDKDVAKMIFLLAKMFRTVLDSSQENYRIRDELKYAEEFMSLQNLRFSGRFIFTYDVEESLLDMRCIPILFQPLVENCIEHGWNNEMERMNIRITGKREEKLAIFRVYDDGTGMDEKKLNRTRERLEKTRKITGPLFRNKDMDSYNIGLTNILMRLKLLDEQGGDLNILYSNSSGTCVELCIYIDTQLGKEG